MKLRCCYSLLVFMALTTATMSYSQETVHSGILHSTAQGEEFNLLKIHSDQLVNKAMLDAITKELEKYSESIVLIDGDYLTHKVLIKYKNAMSANMILGILERVYIDAYYLDENGNQVRYQKTGTESFTR